tara:strand:- start:137 stop:535 length:399 start_codon:yes stop_codon:yes gene_type:complete
MSAEDRKKERLKKVLDVILDSNPITKISREIGQKTRSLLKGKLTKEKEFTIKGLISDLKLEVGDRGAAEAMPKKAFEKSVLISKARKGMKNAKPAFRGITSARQSKGRAGMTQQEMRSSNDKKFKGHTGRGG